MIDTADDVISILAHLSLLKADAYEECKLGHNDTITCKQRMIHAASDCVHEGISQLVLACC